MKKIISAFIALYLLVPAARAQDDEIRPKALGVSFFLNDFVSPERIRTTSLSQVLSDKSMAKIKEMSPGLAVTYFKGIRKSVSKIIGRLAQCEKRFREKVKKSRNHHKTENKRRNY